MARKVIIRAKKPTKMGFIQFSPYTGDDGKLVELIDPNGVAIDKWTMTRPAMTLDLEEENDARLYAFLSKHPLIIQGVAKLVNVTEQEQQEADRALTSADAVICAAKMNMKEYRDFAKLAGFGTVSNDDVLKARVVQMAYKTPEKFLAIYNDDDKDIRTFVVTAIDKQIFKFSNDVWKYGSTTIGLTKDSIIVWLKENVDVYALLKNQLREESKPKKAKKVEAENEPINIDLVNND